MRNIWCIFLSLMLTACGSDKLDDLRKFVKDSEQGLRGKIDPLPEIKPYESFEYTAGGLPDPFKPRKLQPSKNSAGGPQPDLNRRKEALESYPLENLKMVGTLQKNNLTYAIVKTPDNNLYQVKIGNYMGQNFGIVTGITENEIRLTEIVQDSAGDWTERNTSITLSEDQKDQKQK